MRTVGVQVRGHPGADCEGGRRFGAKLSLMRYGKPWRRKDLPSMTGM